MSSLPPSLPSQPRDFSRAHRSDSNLSQCVELEAGSQRKGMERSVMGWQGKVGPGEAKGSQGRGLRGDTGLSF